MIATVNTVSEYIKRNDLRRNATCILSNGIKSYVVDGIGLSEDEFENKYPLVEYIPSNSKGDNCHKRVGFITNQKSY